jgi:D-alanyl-D-alanine endopeptidase (penicillin-binding protein 7)
MSKPVLTVFCSFLLVLFSLSTAIAADRPARTGTSKKHGVSKSAGVSKTKVASRRRVVIFAPGGTVAARGHLVKKVVLVHGKRKVVYQRLAYAPVLAAIPMAPSAGDLAGLNLTHDALDLKSSVAYVLDQSNSEVLFEKNANVALPMASITKLMTSLVVVEANQNMDEVLTITDDDVDREKFSSSRLKVGAQMTRANMLHIALMSSENRAASALGRNYPGGLPAFVSVMNAKAKMLGMADAHYVDANGLSRLNVASARDLAKLVMAAHQYPIIRQYSTDPKYAVDTGGRTLQYANTNHLVANPEWEIGLQKTGYISEAGRCLVMQAKIEGRPVVMVFLDSKGKQSRLGDAGRIRKWLEDLKAKALSLRPPGGGEQVN